MFRNFLTKSFFRIITLLALVLFIGVFIFALELDKHNVPPQDMRAHFAYDSQKAPVDSSGGNDLSDLSKENTSSRELSSHLSEIVAESLSFDKGNFVYNSGAMEKYFTPEGYAQYKEFLTKSDFQGMLNSGDLQSGVILEQSPLELTSGVYGGVYKWVFEVPVTLSFIPQDMESYRAAAKAPQNRRFMLRVQFARVKDANDPEAVRIEIWQVLPPRSY